MTFPAGQRGVMKHKTVLQFRIELLGITPAIWRRIEVPSSYSFWDLHVAIQDSMGWLDYHLHEFSIKPPDSTKPVTIGLPYDEPDAEVMPGWEVPVSAYLSQLGDESLYIYDYGDGWEHRVVLEDAHLQQKGAKYPICTDGERACPPEDCGGVGGYYNLLEILADPKHEEHEDMVSWLTDHAKSYWPYDPARFERSKVRFDNPKKRLRAVLAG